MTAVKITGIFSWDGQERRTDRYGFVTVDRVNYDRDALAEVTVSDPETLSNMTNHRSSITVRVVEARDSGHLGDATRNILPKKPEVGTTFELGVGMLRFVEAAWSPLGVAFGLEPKDGRPNNWFDPHILYQLHDQTVEITIQNA